MPRPDETAINAALATVNDPEIGKPITELKMVDGVTIADDGTVGVTILLTVASCPMKGELTGLVRTAVSAVEGVSNVDVHLGVMTD